MNQAAFQIEAAGATMVNDGAIASIKVVPHPVRNTEAERRLGRAQFQAEVTLFTPIDHPVINLTI